jgi:hypothetical protein
LRGKAHASDEIGAMFCDRTSRKCQDWSERGRSHERGTSVERKWRRYYKTGSETGQSVEVSSGVDTRLAFAFRCEFAGAPGSSFHRPERCSFGGKLSIGTRLLNPNMINA